MHRQSLKESQQEALENALQDLETTRMTPSNDPKLAALKEDIRRAIKKRLSIHPLKRVVASRPHVARLRKVRGKLN